MDSLLETRELLFEIAFELYGEMWVIDESFWGSPTEKQLSAIQMQLYELGHEEDLTNEQIAAANKLAKDLGFEL